MLEVHEQDALGLVTDEGAEVGSHDNVPAILELFFRFLLDEFCHVFEVLVLALPMPLCCVNVISLTVSLSADANNLGIVFLVHVFLRDYRNDDIEVFILVLRNTTSLRLLNRG